MNTTADTTHSPSENQGTVLSVRALYKSFTLHSIDGRTVPSLRGVDLDVHTGEHVALAGPSGAGKSSLLRCVYRTYLPDSGSVRLRTPAGTVELTTLPDREMARLRGRQFGYVSQFLAAPPRTGPLEVVAATARRRGLDRGEAREAAAAALRRLHLDETLWDVDCGVLSGGERQRVNLAAGTVQPPRLLLLDEPVSALDPANREAALELVDSLAGQGVAVLAVFHDMDAIRRLASRVVFVGDGRIARQGAPEQMLEAAA
ncbi:phosphonate C-P lyase system protein PhnL [Streptomyces antimycoticus]|uniref:ABC transporter ATP-binding protein n=1 Tax=Streptomyces antimycoticus TaxID=68175 RepID=A0A4D4JY79_9ACTN|nr:ATP-binding cassette domain-containing protein [Streptomyces antimycoticus]GDY39368.1 ABC transporter ATP-binding protein [Streptomyces antimycoticus]